MITPIVTLTVNPAIDVASEVDKIHAIRKIRTINERYEPGGGGINVARVIAELGGSAVAFYMAGGATGPTLENLLDHEGIDHLCISISDHTRISQTIFECSSGLEYRFVPRGPQIHAGEWGRCLDILRETVFDYLVASGSLAPGMPADFYVRVAKIVREKNARLVLDTSGPALRLALEAGGIHMVKPSLGELEDAVGRSLPDSKAQHEAAMAYVETGKVEFMAVTLGREGALLAWKGGVLGLPSIEVKSRSAVGAGDSFVGAMTLLMARGRPIEEAFRYGIAAGAAAVLTPGTQLCRRDDVERLNSLVRTHW
jgi:6-phosphofructokinase 2